MEINEDRQSIISLFFSFFTQQVILRTVLSARNNKFQPVEAASTKPQGRSLSDMLEVHEKYLKVRSTVAEDH
jgi:hypothetical protein